MKPESKNQFLQSVKNWSQLFRGRFDFYPITGFDKEFDRKLTKVLDAEIELSDYCKLKLEDLDE